MEKVINRLKLIGKEILNFLTNIVIPLIPILMILLELFGAKKEVLEKVKKWEYALFEICGTKKDIDNME